MRKSVWIMAMLLVVMLLNGQTKHALVIGIGKYPVLSGWKRINGDRDADSVINMLNASGFRDVVCLKNEKATKANILKEFGFLTQRCQSGDIVYVHFSGHGQQVEDMNGDEKDGLDESWIPYDACVSLCPKDSGEKHLTDDEVGILLDRIYYKVGENGKILVVADACHSGSSTRLDGETEVVRGTSEVFQSKHKSPTIEVNENWILISACEDNQSNVELKIKEQYSMGKLTYAITWLMKDGCKNDNVTLERRIQQFFDKHRSSHGEQTLVVSGATGSFEISELFVK